MSRLVASAVVVSAVAAAVLAGGTPAAAAPPPGACQGTPDPAREPVTELPWAQQLLDLDRTWPHSTGAGVTVAVVDSGVDADHPQLRGKVLRGQDFFHVGDLPGNFDCVSHGTAAASIIAASPAPGIGFRGVAPDARILPVRITDRELSDDGQPTPINPEAVGQGIRYAADHGAKVINLSLSGHGNYRAIGNAVAYAQSKDVLVVAAVGNRADNGNIASFPAQYDGVLGVGSLTITGERANGSQTGTYVDIMAPGEDVLAATRVGGHNFWAGTSFATPFVTGVAALVRSAWPKLTAPEVAARILATADPAPGGRDSETYGAGIVNPYRAVTEDLTDAAPLMVPPVVEPPPDHAAMREADWWADTSAEVKIGAGLVVLAIAVAGVLGWFLPRGRRRRWYAGRAALPPATPTRQEPPDQIFLFPAPAAERHRR
ncbi:type VII secretion-associated serine protease mycosin [Actinophytocola gossypii]|uniref:Type VII secretion-associated serine protease mycosin n=1 Tax=Actinophytocola gossypii TaxID=2812003 RepID=A0ABT2JDP9_9PSEU|nr:type VII secretion-associated serine protease mycosin [Actinophytocola gossypii]MCT2585901.1 type VII secretion-associated serine protease mycosin [Actinophytocola gossypii]